MSFFRRMVWLITLCLFASGCSATYQSAVLPNAVPKSESDSPANTIKVGQDVRVSLISGQVYSGEVLSISEDYLVIYCFMISEFKEREVKVADINQLEIKEVKGSKTAGYVGLIALGIAAVGGIIYLISVGNSFDN